ncbi:siderophore-interacting protein [Blastococcus sp. TML/C7B]|uniref:siderophore-interacting protein n=1 Tax=Blastococcus sp. TML/C7B TaxID=2798728 RepID=UPI00281511C3|nr:siderophore-interacting protein [Blastococcus sp. TML/C7B]
MRRRWPSARPPGCCSPATRPRFRRSAGCSPPPTPGTTGVALLEVAGPEEEQPLAAPPGVEVRWLHRKGTPPGESTLLVDAVAALDRPGTDDVFAWVGAESAAVRAIRADLRGRWGLGRAQHHAIGYWRRGRAMAPPG